MIKNISGLSEKFDQLESRLKALVEGSFARLLPTKSFQDELEKRLVAAMRSGVEIMPEGVIVAPDTYTILVHPDMAFRLKSSDKMLSELSRIIEVIGEQIGLIFAKSPEVRLASKSNLDFNVVQVTAQINLENLGETVKLKRPQARVYQISLGMLS